MIRASNYQIYFGVRCFLFSSLIIIKHTIIIIIIIIVTDFPRMTEGSKKSGGGAGGSVDMFRAINLAIAFVVMLIGCAILWAIIKDRHEDTSVTNFNNFVDATSGVSYNTKSVGRMNKKKRRWRRRRRKKKKKKKKTKKDRLFGWGERRFLIWG